MDIQPQPAPPPRRFQPAARELAAQPRDALELFERRRFTSAAGESS